MASHSQPRVLTFTSTAAIAKGKSVTLDATGKLVTAANAKTDKQIGIAMNAATAAGEKVEVALNGGGAKGLLGNTVSAGDLLSSTTGGALIATTTAADRWVAVAMEDGVANDLISVEVDLGLI